MNGLEVTGTVVSSADALLKTYYTLQRRDAGNELLRLLSESKERVERIRASVDRYSHGVPENAILRKVLESARFEFDRNNSELEPLLVTQYITFQSPEQTKKVRKCYENLRVFEQLFDGCVLSLREQWVKLVDSTRKTLESQDASVVSGVLESIAVTLYASGEDDQDDVDVIPEQARNLLNALSRSGIPSDEKLDLSKRARMLWKGWKVHLNDIEFVRKSSGDRKRIGKGGAADVYLAHMKIRDENDDVVAGEHIEVAVKQVTVPRSEAEGKFPQFMREVFLQKHAQHPCIVRTFGGYWPDQEEIEDDDDEICAWIVMERMTHNLRQVLNRQLLGSLESKRRIIRDVADGIAHLHSRGIVHRDVKPENVLMRVVDGQIIGRAKVCDFGVSRKAEETDLWTHSTQEFTRPTGSSLYMPPEAFSSSARDTSSRARDIWSFGVLMCEVLEPAFLSNIVRDNSDGLLSLAGHTEFAKKVAESAHSISCDWVLEHVVISCLLLDPVLRPRIQDLSSRIANDANVYQFHFNGPYSWNYKSNEVLRYVRNCFGVETETSNIDTAIAILEESVRVNSNSSAYGVLGYCYYYGIGVEQDGEKAIALFQNGCDAGDGMAMLGKGVAHFWGAQVDHAQVDQAQLDHAVHLFTEAAQLGCTGAILWLAECYEEGDAVEKDEKRAFQLMSSAAEAGNEYAMVRLAWYYYVGFGTINDEEKGTAMLHRSSANGNPYATMRLSMCYKEGYGVTVNEENEKQLILLAEK